MGDPAQHFAWALFAMPTVAGSGAITNPQMAADWSRHLYACGFRHVTDIAKLADDDGNIDVAKLPRQQIKMQNAFRGPRNAFNMAARWVPMETPDPEPVQVPDVRDYTQVERDAIRRQLVDQGAFDDFYAPQHSVAEVEL